MRKLMCKFIFALLALAISLFGTQCWASTCLGGEGLSCTNTFSPTNTTNTYEFFGDGRLIVQFDTVLTTFDLTVSVNRSIDPLNPTEFPVGTVCVQYLGNGSRCDQYDFTGLSGGPNGVPVRKIDYKGLITLTLSYLTTQSIHHPAFGHAPGDNATAVYSEDILTGYSSSPVPSDPTMKGKTPGLSSVAAFDEPSTENDKFCLISPQELQTFTAGREIEVAFQLFSNTTCTGTPIRDKTARISLSLTDSFGNFISFPPLRDRDEGNKFHWDDGVNEIDLSTDGLLPGSYTITIFGSKFSPPQSVDIILKQGDDE